MPKFHRTDLSAYSLLNEFRVDEKFHDIVINIGRRSFPCHRIVLASSMTYFQNLFGSRYYEHSVGFRARKKIKEIDLLEVKNADHFEYVLRYVYGTPIRVVEENVLGLLEISHVLGPRCLYELCAEYAAENFISFSLDSVLNLFAFASRTENTMLVDALIEWVAENFAWMSERKKFVLVRVRDLLKVLTHPNLIADVGAQAVFLLNWIRLYDDEDEEESNVSSLSSLLHAMIGF